MSTSDAHSGPGLAREEALFQAAAALSGTARATYLDGACHGDAALRQRLDSLLAAHEQTDTLLDTTADAGQPAREPDLTDAPDEAVGQTLGRYKLLERIGEGGCGVVYVAEQTEPVRRRVALKVIKLGMDTKQVVARFEAERQALAMMDHPNIAKVLDAGTTGPAEPRSSRRESAPSASGGDLSRLTSAATISAGRPYFVMELVRGIRITDYCDQANLSTKERLDLFIKVCQAIQHAHQKGIIHRDIKPSNILVTLHDGVPVPKVIDFGIAKATEGRLTDNTVYTQLHQFIGTPAYMSPEQAEMSGLDIDTRSDIYSLGVLLYELLAGSTPFDAKELMAGGIDAMRKTIREKEPVRPSTKLRQTLVAANVSSLKSPDTGKPTTEEEVRADSRRLLRVKETITLLQGDLDWIVMKCLEKDRARRYETANGLAADLKRHLNNEPVVARPPSAVYKFQKAFRRNKLAFAAGTAIVAALAFGVVGTSIGLVRAERQRQTAEASQRLAEQRFLVASRFVADVFQEVAPKFTVLIGASEAREALAQTSVAFLEALGGTNSSDDAFRAELGTLYGDLGSALGDPYAPNSIGDYDTALRFATQSLTIAQSLLKQNPSDENWLKLSRAEDRVGNILRSLERPDEAIIHHRRMLELGRQMLDRHPGNAAVQARINLAQLRIGHDLRGQGQTRAALEQHYLPAFKRELDQALDRTLNSYQVFQCAIAHGLVGDSEMELQRPREALPHLEAALEWVRILVEREPNNARYARDWSSIHSKVGTAQIALGRFDEALTNLQTGVHLAETLVVRDSMNGPFQVRLIDSLQQQANGLVKLASSSSTFPVRQAELLRQAIQAFTRCQERLALPALERSPSRLSKQAQEITQELSEARRTLSRITGDSGARPAQP